MIALNKTHEGLVKIPITSAVETWFKKKRKNLGLVITVKDSNDHEIDPFDVFESYNCSQFSKL